MAREKHSIPDLDEAFKNGGVLPERYQALARPRDADFGRHQTDARKAGLSFEEQSFDNNDLA